MPSTPPSRQRARESAAAAAPRSIDCAKTRTLLDAFVDGELRADDDATVRDHVTTCSECRQLDRSLRQLLATIARSDPHVVAPRRLRLRVAQALLENDPTTDA